MRRVILAQGMGFYGVGFFTTDLSWEKLVLTLLKEPNMHVGGDQIHIDYPPDTGVLIKEFSGNAQESVVVLYDSGHSEVDCHVLNHLCCLLKSPYITNGAMEKKFLDRKDALKLVKKYKLNLAAIKAAACAGV